VEVRGRNMRKRRKRGGRRGRSKGTETGGDKEKGAKEK
jgi:hypothetical protein